MKKSISLVFGLLMSVSAFAEAPNTLESIVEAYQLPNISLIERSYSLSESFEGGRLNLVEITNGGSRDALSRSSELYLTYFKNGEQTNLAATFALGGIDSFSEVTQTGRTEFKITVVRVDAKTLKKNLDVITLNVAGLVKAIRTVQLTAEDEFNTKLLSAKVNAIGVR